MIEYNMALASASSNTKPVGVGSPPYLLPSWTLLKPSLCLYRQVDCDVNVVCGINITVYNTVEEPLVHRGSSVYIHKHITVMLSYCNCELDVFPNRGREWLVMLVATQYKDRMLITSNLSRVPIRNLTNANVNKPTTSVQSWIDACCGKLTQLTMEVI